MQRNKLMIILLGCAALLLTLMIVLLVLPSRTPDTPDDSAPAAPTANATTLPTGAPSQDASAEEVIRQYVAFWNAKDTAGMDACRIEADRGMIPYDELQYQEAIALRSVETMPREQAQSEFQAQWYENPAETALVQANLGIMYNEEGRTYYQADGLDRTDYRYWLVRETADGPWRIALEGY